MSFLPWRTLHTLEQHPPSGKWPYAVIYKRLFCMNEGENEPIHQMQHEPPRHCSIMLLPGLKPLWAPQPPRKRLKHNFPKGERDASLSSPSVPTGSPGTLPWALPDPMRACHTHSACLIWLLPNCLKSQSPLISSSSFHGKSYFSLKFSLFTNP